MMGVDHITPTMVEEQYQALIQSKGGFTFGVFKELVKDMAGQFRKQDGSFYALLSLQEAEHFRAILHARQGMSLLGSELLAPRQTSAGMWIMSDHDMYLLAQTANFEGATQAQHASMVNSFRFVNSDTHFNDGQLTVLLRVLESDACLAREKWWTEVRSCRRRRQIALDGSIPIITVFNTQNEFEFMEYKAIVSRVQQGLQDMGMLIYDAFRAFNSSNSGLLSCSELYGGMDYLGIPFTPQQIYDLVRKICIQNEVASTRLRSCRCDDDRSNLMHSIIAVDMFDSTLQGLVSYEDFKRVFQSSDEEMESRAIGYDGESNFEVIPPKPIPELVDLNQVRLSHILLIRAQWFYMLRCD